MLFDLNFGYVLNRLLAYACMYDGLINQFIMSTVPKLTYAKIGKGPKVKVQSVSSQLSRNREEKSDDLFSQMNQENLKYIQKELKLKKNRSDQEKAKPNPPDFRAQPQEAEQQLTQRDKLYHKYRGNQEVIQKEPHLQQTQRCSDIQKPLFMVFNEQSEEPDEQAENLMELGHNREVKQIDNKLNLPQNKMYQSLPQEEGKRRMASIQNHFGQAMSTNLNKQDGGQFIEFLEEYISDLNQSIHIKTKQNEDVSVDKQQFDQLRNSKQKQSSRTKPKQEKRQLDLDLKANIKRLQKIKRSSDTFGQPNSKFTLKSQEIQSQSQFHRLQLQLKGEKLNNINLAKEIQKLRQLLEVKQSTIKKLEIENELFQEQILHVQKKQEILNRNRKSTQNLRDFPILKSNSRVNKMVNDENFQHRDTINFHYRNASANAQKAAVSYRSSFKVQEDFAELFQHNNIPQKESRHRQRMKKKDNESLQKVQREYEQFKQTLNRERKEMRGRRAHQVIY